MKTLEQLFEEIRNSVSLQEELAECINDKKEIEMFLKKYDCESTLEEAKLFLTEKGEEMKASGELTPEQLEQAAGGTWGLAFIVPVITSLAAEIGTNVVNSLRNNCD